MLKIIKIFLMISTLLNINYTYCYYSNNSKITNNINTTKYNIRIKNNFDKINNKITIRGNNVILPTIYKDGYDNIGFKVEDKTINNNVLISDINNKTLIPLWKLVNYNIKYDLDGGLLNNMINTYNIEDNIILDKPIKEGYKFIGWTGSNGDTPQEVVYIKNMYGNKYYKANYIIDDIIVEK